MDGLHYSVREDATITLSIEGKKCKMSYHIPSYRIMDGNKPMNIAAVSFSCLSPDVLFMLAGGNMVFSLCVRSQSITRMTIDSTVRRESMFWAELQCHNEFVYLAVCHHQVNQIMTVYKCIVQNQFFFKVISEFTNHCTFLAEVDGSGQLYCVDLMDDVIEVVDGNSLLETARISMHGHYYDMTVRVDGTLVGLCENNYDDDNRELIAEHCDNVGKLIGEYRCPLIDDTIIAETLNYGRTLVGTTTELIMLSSDFESIEVITSKDMDFSDAKCSKLDNTLAIVGGRRGQRVRFLLLPPETYVLPFSLTSLCVSAVLKHSEVLLTTYLPVGLQRLMMNYLQFK